MPELWNNERQQAENVADEMVADALASQRYGLPTWAVQGTHKRVPVLAPDGTPGTVPAASLIGHLREGFRLETPADVRKQQLQHEMSGPVGTAAAFTAGGADMLTFGIASQLLAKDGLGEELDAAKAEHPIASAAGTMLGAVTPVGAGGLAATLGRSAAARVSERAGASALGRLLSVGARGAAEGATFGAADLVSEEAIGDADWSAMSIASHVGGGALLGGGLGAAFAGAGMGAKKLAGEIAPRLMSGGKVQDVLSGIADDMAIKAVVGHQKAAFRKLHGKGLTADAARFVREDLGLKVTDSAASLSQRLRPRLDEIGGELDALVQRLDASGARVSGSAVAGRLRATAGEKYAGQAVRTERDWLIAQADEIEALGDMPVLQAVTERRAAQRAAAYNALEPQGQQLAKRLRATAWNDAIDEAAVPALRGAGLADDAYRALRRREWVGIELSKFADSEWAGGASRNWLGLHGNLLLGHGMIAGEPVTGVAAALARKATARYGAAVTARVAHRLSNIQSINRMATGAHRRVEKAIGSFARGGTPTAPRALSAALAGSFGVSTDERKGTDDTVEDMALARAQEIRRLVADPEALAARIAATVGDLDDDAPQTAEALAGLTGAMASFLSEKAGDVLPSYDSVTPRADGHKPTAAAAAKFARYVAAATDPLGVVEELAGLSVSTEGIETLRALYPSLHERVSREIGLRLAERKEPLPYPALVVLSVFTGQPTHPTLRPEAIARAQRVYAKQGGPQEGGGGGKAPRRPSERSAKQIRDSIASHATRTQELEANA